MSGNSQYFTGTLPHQVYVDGQNVNNEDVCQSQIAAYAATIPITSNNDM